MTSRPRTKPRPRAINDALIAGWRGFEIEAVASARSPDLRFASGTTPDLRRNRAVSFLRDGAVTFAALLLSFAAFDDITTGNEMDFTFEYAALLGAAGWLLFVTFRLIAASRRLLGAISLVALACALWGQREIGPGITPQFWPAYMVTLSAFFWFTIVAVVLLASAWQGYRERQDLRA
jgi:hypothetical protein